MRQIGRSQNIVFEMPETKFSSPDFFKTLNTFAKHHHGTLWLGTRFLPEGERFRALSLLVLDGEFYKVATTASEGMIGQIRLQWWRDEIDRLKEEGAPQGSLAGQALSGLLARNPADGLHVHNLINAYDDYLSGANTAYAPQLFSALMDAGVEGEAHDKTSLAWMAGDVFQNANSARPDADRVKQLANRLDKLSDKDWAFLCLFELLPDWTSKKGGHALQRRWRIWRAFLGGEERLAKRLRRFAESLPG